jgi:hypothetical protein
MYRNNIQSQDVVVVLPFWMVCVIKTKQKPMTKDSAHMKNDHRNCPNGISKHEPGYSLKGTKYDFN